jgi:hypothetical protein
MKLVLAILMVFGIFVGIPIIIGLAISGGYMPYEQRIQNIKRTRSAEKNKENLRETAKENEHIEMA